MGEGVVLKLDKHHEKVADGIRTQAKQILETDMPAKVLKLNELVEKYASDLGVVAENNGFVREFDKQDAKRQKRGTAEQGGDQFQFLAKIPSNEKVVEYWEVLRKETIDILEMTAAVKVWIQLNVPKVEDGNNFGVGVQEELINELSRAEESASAVLDTATRYHASRAKLVTKCLKYADNIDYRLSIKEVR